MAEEFIERLTGASAGANATSRACCAVISPQLAKPQSRMAGSMTGMSEEKYRDMMVSGGRNIEGNRYTGEKK